MNALISFITIKITFYSPADKPILAEVLEQYIIVYKNELATGLPSKDEILETTV